MRRWRRLLALQAAVSGLVAFAVTAIWAMTGGSFWPIWVWYGLAIPFGLNAALFGAAHVKRGRWRKFAFHAAVSGWVSATLVLTWAMAGSDDFWPTIPVVCLAMLVALRGPGRHVGRRSSWSSASRVSPARAAARSTSRRTS